MKKKSVDNDHRTIIVSLKDSIEDKQKFTRKVERKQNQINKIQEEDWKNAAK